MLRFSLPLAQAVDPEGCAAWEARCLAERAAFEASALRIARRYNFNTALLRSQSLNRLNALVNTPGWEQYPLYRRAYAIALERNAAPAEAAG